MSECWDLIISSMTGPYSVGYKNIEFMDENREDPYDAGHDRRLKVTVYYPSNDAPKFEPYGVEEMVFWQRELKEPLDSKDITPEDLKAIDDQISCAQVYKSSSAIPAACLFPVILFGHGLGVTAGSYQSFLLEVVSHGYTIVTPGSPYIAGTVIFQDGTEAFLKAERDKLVFTTSFQDVQFILNKIDEIASIVPSIDLSAIGMMGHSLGGATTIKIARSNESIKAGVGLDSPICHNIYDYEGDESTISLLDSDIELDDGSDIDRPFLHIFAAKPINDHSAIHLKNNNFKAVIEGTEHNSFADHGILKDKITVFKAKKWHLGAGCSDASSYRPEMIQLILSFFDKFLKNKPVDLMTLNSDLITLIENRDYKCGSLYD